MSQVQQYDQILELARTAHELLEHDEEGEALQYAVIKAGSSRRDASKAEDLPFLASPEQMARRVEGVARGWADTQQKLYLCVFDKGGPNPRLMRPLPSFASSAPAPSSTGHTYATDRAFQTVELLALDANRRLNETLDYGLRMQQDLASAREDLATVIAHSNSEEKPSEMIQALEMLMPALPFLLMGKAPPQLEAQEEEGEALELPEMTAEEAAQVGRGLVNHLCALCKAHPEAVVPELAPLLQVEEVVQNLLQLA